MAAKVEAVAEQKHTGGTPVPLTRRENLRRLRELLRIVVQMNRIKRHELHRLSLTELNRRNSGENTFSKPNLFFLSVSIRVNPWLKSS